MLSIVETLAPRTDGQSRVLHLLKMCSLVLEAEGRSPDIEADSVLSARAVGDDHGDTSMDFEPARQRLPPCLHAVTEWMPPVTPQGKRMPHKRMARWTCIPPCGQAFSIMTVASYTLRGGGEAEESETPSFSYCGISHGHLRARYSRGRVVQHLKRRPRIRLDRKWVKPPLQMGKKGLGD